MKNVIFYFTGTGNSLKVAKDIAAAIGECDIVAIATHFYEPYTFTDAYKRIGFIFPVYAEGLPNLMKRFVAEIELPSDQNVYYFAVATHGGLAGNGVALLTHIRQITKETNRIKNEICLSVV